MGQYTNKGIKDVVINFLLFIVLVLLLLIPAYFCYKIFLVDTKNVKEQPQEEVIPTEEIKEEEVMLEETAPYKEFFPILEDQQAYVMVPGKIDSEEPLVLIIYSHGALSTVTQNMQDPFMIDLQEYGKYFTQHNYIFAASNQHGANMGNNASIRDTLNLKNWVELNYNIQPKIYMVAFSMGGLPTLNFASEYPEMVSKVALLAGTTRPEEWNSTRAKKVKGIEIRMWNGDQDENTPYSNAVNFVNTMRDWEIDITLITLRDKTHWDVDTEYMEDILAFFEE